IAEAVFRAFGAASPLQPRTWVAAVAAMSAYFVANEGLVALVISLAEREPLRDVLFVPMGLNVLHWAGSVAIGIVATVMWTLEPAGAIFLLLPLGLSYLAYESWLNSTRERDRMRNLYDAGQALLSRLEEAGDFRPFLDVVRRLLDADEAYLVEGTVPESRDGHEAAVVGGEQDPRGALVVVRPDSFTPARRSLLESLAAQVYVKMRHIEVF